MAPILQIVEPVYAEITLLTYWCLHWRHLGIKLLFICKFITKGPRVSSLPPPSLPPISAEIDVISASKLKAKGKTNLNASIELVMMKFAQNDGSY